MWLNSSGPSRSSSTMVILLIYKAVRTDLSVKWIDSNRYLSLSAALRARGSRRQTLLMSKKWSSWSIETKRGLECSGLLYFWGYCVLLNFKICWYTLRSEFLLTLSRSVTSKVHNYSFRNGCHWGSFFILKMGSKCSLNSRWRARPF